MIWYDDSYRKTLKKWKIRSWKISTMLMLIACDQPAEQMTVCYRSSVPKELMQRYYPKKNLVIIGICKGICSCYHGSDHCYRNHIRIQAAQM